MRSPAYCVVAGHSHIAALGGPIGHDGSAPVLSELAHPSGQLRILLGGWPRTEAYWNELGKVAAGNTVALFWHGNQHLSRYLLAPDPRFDFVLASEPDLSLDEAATIVPEAFVRASFMHTVQALPLLLRLLQRAGAGYGAPAVSAAAPRIGPFCAAGGSLANDRGDHRSVSARAALCRAQRARFEVLTRQHLRATRQAFETCDVFIATLGLTEAWVSTRDGAVFPACPGTVAGTFDPERHAFVNFTAGEVAADLGAFVTELRAINPRVRVILTVSPVPLVATATPHHVLAADTYSKATLRVAAEAATREHRDVHYFPSYEIVTGARAPREFFESDRRTVSKQAVDIVMAAFLAQCERGDSGAADQPPRPASNVPTVQDLSRRIIDDECEHAAMDLRKVQRNES